VKNVVICCDGTANEFKEDRTNVVKLFSVLVQDPAQQVAYYHPGVGTMEAVGALTSTARKVTRLLGKAIGYGLEADVRDAYVFLMNIFEPGDHVFLFGFSRGAYTVRTLAALLHMYGLIRKGNEPLVPYGIRMLNAAPRNEGISSLKSDDAIAALQPNMARAHAPGMGFFALAEDFKKIFSREECKPWFVGLWDTVSSVGWIENPLRLPYTADNPDIEIGRHAISIDERRAFFRTNLWRPKNPPPQSGPKDLKQVWFAGVHCDVGGGYPENESGLSKITLEWMIKEAVEAGLLVDPTKVDLILGRSSQSGAYVTPDPEAPSHESLKGAWWLAEFFFKRHYNWDTRKWERRFNLGRRRTIPKGSLIHESVFLRKDYHPDLPNDAVKTR
jgi:uncharacterized protein (DUF2235 family)